MPFAADSTGAAGDVVLVSLPAGGWRCARRQRVLPVARTGAAPAPGYAEITMPNLRPPTGPRPQGLTRP